MTPSPSPDRATPRPWFHTPGYYYPREIYSDGGAGQGAGARLVAFASGKGFTEEEAEANAALIVRAVNRDHLFDELVAALDALLSFSSEQAGAWEARASARALLAKVKP